MTKEQFNAIVANQVRKCIETLEEKAKEYAPGADRLEHFKVSGAEQEIMPREALWGMASKHMTSLGNMCRNELTFSGDPWPVELWSEKITDAINYLFLLCALIEEETS